MNQKTPAINQAETNSTTAISKLTVIPEITSQNRNNQQFSQGTSMDRIPYRTEPHATHRQSWRRKH